MMSAVIVCISGSKGHTEDQVHRHQGLHTASGNNSMAYVLVPHYAKV